jgi:hypothetical protein
MLYAGQDLTFGCAITFERIGDDDTRDVLEPFQQLPEEAFRCVFVPAALHQDIEHNTILVHCTPQGMSLATDDEENFIEMSCVATMRTRVAQLVRIRLSEFETPLMHRFIRDHDPTLSHQFFHITKTERETERQPHSVTDHLRRETKPFIIGRWSVCWHEAILVHCSATLPS